MSSSGVNLGNYFIPLEEIKCATENFSEDRCIGDGGFGKVYKAQLSERWQNRIAAVKRLDPDIYQGNRMFQNELAIISISDDHENIISFIGYCDEANAMIIVYEYAMNGSLDYFLEDPSKMRDITWIQRLKICIGVAKGLCYLHSDSEKHNSIIHRDVKSSNILLDDNLVAKIGDFGLSRLRLRNESDTHYTDVAGTQFYMDPAYRESHTLRKQSDVYSFGVVLFEILSGKPVYYESAIGNDKKQFLMTYVRKYYKKEPQQLIDPHIKDQIDSSSFNAFQEIAYKCINLQWTERPKMDMVVKRVEEALRIQVSFLI